MRAKIERVAAALFLVAAAFSLSSCAFLAQDMFPDYLQYEDASFDLGAALDGLGLSYTSVVKIERLTPVGGAPRLFVLLYASSGQRLLVLDDGLSGIEALRSDSGLATFMLGGVAGGYACGTVVLSSDLSSVSAAIDSYSALGCTDASGYVDEASSENVVVRSTGASSLTKARFSPAWAATASASLVLFTGDASTYYVADVLSLDAASALVVALLPGYGSQPRLLVYPNRAAFDTAMASTYAASGATVLSPDLYIQDRKLWLTAGGAVALSYDNNRKALVRISYGTGKELDRVYVDDRSSEDEFGFDPQGEYWYTYNSATRKLYKLRTWW